MSPSSIAAKAKYAQVLEDAKGNMHAGYKSNRVVTTRHPSTGTCEISNSVNRRTSHSSQGSTDNGRFRTMIKNMLSPPAF